MTAHAPNSTYGDAITVDHVVCAVDSNIVITPEVIGAQMHSGIAYGLTATLWDEMMLRSERAGQSNFDRYRNMRIGERPNSIGV